MNRDISLRFNQYLLENKIWYTRQRLDYFLSLHFRGFNLTGSNILEIGAGPGYFSVWCVVNGARNVVALEPEAAGSTGGIGKEFEKLVRVMNLGDKVKYLPMTLDEYLTTQQSETFDYVFMHAVVNHLNEDACVKLHLKSAGRAKRLYTEIFKNIHGILNPGGVLSIYDVGRRSFWHDLKLKDPFAPTIEYKKHQQPKVWKKLLLSSGFEFMDMIWVPHFRLRKLGAFVSWWLPVYLTYPGFILRCRKGRGLDG